MILGPEVLKRLNEALEREGLSKDREREGRQVVVMLVPEIVQIIREEVRKATREGIRVRRDVE